LNIAEDEKTILFYGAIRPYKGLEYLVEAFQLLTARNAGYRLIVAGEPKKGSEKYMERIGLALDDGAISRQVTQVIGHVPDEDTELYFKAADVLVLPYAEVFQSGVLFLGHSFGLPVIATDVGSFREEIVEGRTGFLCKPRDGLDLATVIDAYFEDDLFKSLNTRRQEIKDHAEERHSWDRVAAMTRKVYAELTKRRDRS
jgi:D-inositol-3-phosphate glycosyltransferase